MLVPDWQQETAYQTHYDQALFLVERAHAFEMRAQKQEARAARALYHR